MLRCNAYKCYQAARKVTERLSDSAQMNFPAAVGSYQGLKDAGPVNGDDRSLDRRLSGDPGRRGGIHNRWGKRRKARSRAVRSALTRFPSPPGSRPGNVRSHTPRLSHSQYTCSPGWDRRAFLRTFTISTRCHFSWWRNDDDHQATITHCIGDAYIRVNLHCAKRSRSPRRPSWGRGTNQRPHGQRIDPV